MRLTPLFSVILTLLLSGSLFSGPVAYLEPIADNLERPVAIENAGDGSDRLFVVEVYGRIRIIRDDKLDLDPFLDITDRVVIEGEGGMVGLAFHPDYAANRRFFVSYTTRQKDQFKLIVSQFEASADDPDQALSEEKVLLTIDQPTDIHQGGDLHFGPDRFLYISLGDGGPGGDPDNRAQDLNTLLGKILRIDVDGGEPYVIPPDNPFLGQEGAREEIWAYGFRNPFRFGFDRLSGRMFAGDVGETRFEEIDEVVKGGNYGWRRLEATHCYPAEIQSCDTGGLMAPIYEYGREDGPFAAVIGGRIYRGGQKTPFWGRYIFSDFATGRIWALEETSRGVWKSHDLARLIQPVAFGEDESGELYVASFLIGGIYRFQFSWMEVLAQVGDGRSGAGSLRSTIVLSNNSDQEVTAHMAFLDSSGHQREIRLEGVAGTSFPLLIPPHSSRSFTTGGASDPIFSGWGVIVSDVRLASSVLYELRTPEGVVISQAALEGSEFAREFVVWVSRQSSTSRNSALAFVNPSLTDTAQVHFEVVDREGVALAQADFELEPVNHRAFFLSDVVPLPDHFEGTVRLRSNREIAPAALLTMKQIPSAGLSLMQ
ncbi:MAG: PQQ-dependent sugar dehydrogenase [Acidobacteriota bacterium]